MGLKKRLDSAKGRWVEELAQVLWSYHTTPHSTSQETPFKLVYGSNAVIPVEIDEPTIRIEVFWVDMNTGELWINLDLIVEVWEIAQYLKEFVSKNRVARRDNSKVVSRNMKEGDLVLKKAMKNPTARKLGPNWEGPFQVKQKVCKWSYCLVELSGEEVLRTYNAANMTTSMTLRKIWSPSWNSKGYLLLSE